VRLRRRGWNDTAVALVPSLLTFAVGELAARQVGGTGGTSGTTA